jgi:aminomethyltransferase
MENSKKTVLHDFHLKAGANMALFGNYDMPLWYKTGAKAEHLAVIQAAGIFDTSHMASVSMSGKGARELLQRCFSKDLNHCIGAAKTALVDGRCAYGLFLAEDGTVIDDAIVSQLGADSFLVVVNAGMGGVITEHLRVNSEGQTLIEDLTDKVGKMDLQGPDSARILQKLIKDPQDVLSNFPYFSFKGGFGHLSTDREVKLKDDTPLLLSRTGYTGEFGFEMFVDIADLTRLWEQLLQAGEKFGLIPCGLAARDSLRAGAVLPLSHQDIGSWPFANTPWSFALPLGEDGNGFTKDFIGYDALAEGDWEKYTLPFAGFDPRKIAAGESACVMDQSEEEIGTILTCTTDMAIGRVDGEIQSVAGNDDYQPKGLCCGFVLLDRHCNDGELVYLTDGKRKVKVEIRRDVRPGRTARRSIASMLD